MKNNYTSQLEQGARVVGSKGFTLIELLVVISIIGLLASVVLVALSSARARSRDARRMADISQMRSALELYLNDNGTYPAALANLVPSYISSVPTPPLPQDIPTAGCGAAVNNAYTYARTSTSYTITFCLGNTSGTAGAGFRTLTSAGIQ